MNSGSFKGQFNAIHINPVYKNAVLQKIINNGEETHIPAILKNTHINPDFINPSVTIHMNPEFLNDRMHETDLSSAIERKQKTVASIKTITIESETEIKAEPKEQLNKIISKSRLQIIRESYSPPAFRNDTTPIENKKQLLLLTKSKLIRAADNATYNNKIKRNFKKEHKYRLENNFNTFNGIFKFVKRRPRAFVARYALRRSNSTKGSFLTKPKIENKLQNIISINKRLRLININGILYKSSKNRLQRKLENSFLVSHRKSKSAEARLTKDSNHVITAMKQDGSGRTLYIRGTKFVLDPQGFKLTRVAQTIIPSSDIKSKNSKINTFETLNRTPQPGRIDIGGLTYVVSNQSNNVFVRTGTHLALAHLNYAKQRSVTLLSRCLRKTNKPCPIFQRLGKCAALERNRCSKIHERQQVTVCQKFLHGQCVNDNCLLSHNKTLEKMPICRFFLQGTCVRTDCPYLHKKLNRKSEVCEEFRNGYCAHAEQCNKQHVFHVTKSKKKLISNNEHFDYMEGEYEAVEETPTFRYFDDEYLFVKHSEDDTKLCGKKFLNICNQTSKRNLEHDNRILETKKSEENDNECVDSNTTEKILLKRTQLEKLPEFIPLL